MRDYMVGMDIEIRPEDFREDIAVELIKALEQYDRAVGPVTHQDEAKHRVGAVFGVCAHGVLDAVVLGRAIMSEALERIGAKSPMEVAAVEVAAYEDLEDLDLDLTDKDEAEEVQ